MRIRIETPEGILDREIDVPAGPMRLSELARTVLPLSEGGSELAAQKSASLGRPATCGKGCGVCCRQLVSISPAEAWMIAGWIGTQPGPRRQVIMDRFERIKARLNEAGLLEPLGRLDDPALNDADHYALAEAYFRLDLPCPFLERESCAIYPLRPSICREYLVSSPPLHCADPFAQPVERLPNALRIGDALAGLCAQRMKTEIQKIPLALAPSWAENHPEDPAMAWAGPSLMNQFLLHLEVAIGAGE